MSNNWKPMLLATAVVATVALLVIGNMSSRAGSAKAADPNPLLSEWTGPYGGLPPFDQVKVEYFKPALEAAMAENLTEIDKIANDSAPPTFENTIVALEKAGQTLDRVGTIYNVWQSTMSSPDFQVVQREMAPKLAAFSDKITQNEKLFKRIEAVYDARETSNLTPEPSFSASSSSPAASSAQPKA